MLHPTPESSLFNSKMEKDREKQKVKRNELVSEMLRYEEEERVELWIDAQSNTLPPRDLSRPISSSKKKYLKDGEGVCLLGLSWELILLFS